MLNDLEVCACEIVLNEMPDLYAFIEHMEGCSPQNHEAFLKTCQELQNQEYSHRNVCIKDLLQEPAVFKIISRNIDRLDLKYALLKDQWDSTLNKQIYDTEKRVAKEILEKITFKIHLLSLKENARPSEQLLEYLSNKIDFVPDIKTALVSLKQNQVDFDEGIVLCCKFTDKSFTVPDGVEVIASGAFAFNASLETISLGSVREIGERAFLSCTALTEVSLPETVETVYQEAFSGCTALATLEISEGVQVFGDSAFSNCTVLARVAFPESMTEIGRGSFANCTALSYVSIPASMEGIYETAFDGCENLTIYGAAGSPAEDFAEAYEIPFEAIS